MGGAEVERELRDEVERLKAALNGFLSLPQGCSCLPDSGCGIAKARENARRALEGRRCGKP